MFINKLAPDLEFVIALALGAAAGLALLLTSPCTSARPSRPGLPWLHSPWWARSRAWPSWPRWRGPRPSCKGIADLGIVAVSLHALIAVLFRLVLPKVGLRTADRRRPELHRRPHHLDHHLAARPGVEPGSLVTTSAILTATAAFAMQETLGNVLGGIVLQLDHSLNVGDWAKVDDVSGKVVEIRWRPPRCARATTRR